jgi:hypothetical protein
MRFIAKMGMTFSRWRIVPISAGVMAVMGAAACTIINSFGDVEPVTAEAGTGTDAGSESGPQEGGTFDSGFPDKGAIVLSGRILDDAGSLQGVLTAIDPETGKELPNARQTPLNVPMALYDGLRDLWLIMETDGTSLFPVPTDHAVLHVRTLDPGNGTWTTLQSLQVPPPVFGLATVLKNRLVYVGYSDKVDASIALITIDTSDPTQPNIYGITALPEQPFGLIGTRSQTGNGGGINMLLAEPCADAGGAADDAGDASGGLAGGNCLGMQHVAEPTDPDLPSLTFHNDLGPYFGKVAFGSYLTGGVDMILWSLPGGNSSSPGPAFIHSYSPQNGQQVGSPVPFTTGDGFFQPFAFAECQQQALLTSTNEDLAVYSIPLAAATNATAARAALGQSGQGVYFEPYTSTVLAPFTQGDGYVLTAFTLGGTTAQPKLTQRASNWTPPADVRAEVVAVRAPVPAQCSP